MAGLTKKGDVWYALFSVDGKTKWQRIGKMKRSDAKEILRELEIKFDKQKLGLVTDGSIKFKDFTPKFLKHRKANKAKTTYERDITSLKALSNFFGNYSLESINKQLIETYKSTRLSKVSKRTVNIELSCLSTLLKLSVEYNHIKAIPPIQTLTNKQKLPTFLTKQEMSRLFSKATPWLKQILRIQRNAGMRPTEVVRLKWKDVDFENRIVIVNSLKSSEYRTIPFNRELEEVLTYLKTNYVPPYYPHNTEKRTPQQMIYVICMPDGSPIKRYKKSFRRAAKEADLEDVTPHTIRHTFASHLVMSGVDLATVQKLMGHKEISTTMVYVHLTKSHIREAVQSLTWG